MKIDPVWAQSKSFITAVVEEAIREFPRSNATYGLDDLDYEDFIPALAECIVSSLEFDE